MATLMIMTAMTTPVINATTNHVLMIPGRAGDDFYDDDDKDEDNDNDGKLAQ